MSQYKDEKPNLSFAFSKTNEKKTLKHSVLNDSEQPSVENKKYITQIDKNEILEVKEEVLVIPLIKKNKWYLKPDDIDNDDDSLNETDAEAKQKDAASSRTTTGNKLEDAAIEELLHDAATFNEKKINVKDFNDVMIPILLQNKVPGNFETDEKLDVQLRPESNDNDYNDIPIEAFGKAMLRGMGWNEKDKSYKMKEVKARPKGLGLAADKSIAKQLNDVNEKETNEKLDFKKGTHCLVISGRLSGKYGTIAGTDEDNNRVVLQMSLTNEMLNVSRFSVKLITKKEYEKGYRCINQTKVDEYKKIHDDSIHQSNDSIHQSNDANHMSDDLNIKKHKSENGHHHQNTKKLKVQDIKMSSNTPSNGSLESNWLHVNLRVRFIDKKYKSGKYYKSKLIIEDLTSKNNCVCKTENGLILEDINSNQLETVVPKCLPAFVMILNGRYKFQLGELLERQTTDSIGKVQLLSDRDLVLKLDFDDICEYTGHIESHFDF